MFFRKLLLLSAFSVSLSFSSLALDPKSAGLKTDFQKTDNAEKSSLSEESETDGTEQSSLSEESEAEADKSKESEVSEEAEADKSKESEESDTVISAEILDSDVRVWQKKRDGFYMLFLPNDISIPDLKLRIKGITAKSLSSGSYDEKENIIKGAFQKSGDSLSILGTDGEYYIFRLLQDKNTASLEINLSCDLETVNSGSKEDKYSSTVKITDTDGNISRYTDVEFKGRGNSTWTSGSKKPYQLKFQDKISVLGIDKAKKWVLLANAFDETMLRNKLVFDSAEKLNMKFTPEYEFINVWINGIYTGLYMIGEKVEIGSGRVDLSDEKAILVENDSAYYKEEDHWFECSGTYFGVKDTVSSKEEDIISATELFKNKWQGLLSLLKNTKALSLDDLSKYIDVDSFAKWYLLTEYYRSTDGFTASSIYFYMNGPDDVIHYGPSWDHDMSMGNNTDPQFSSPDGYQAYTSPVMRGLLSQKSFSSYVKNLYAENRNVFDTSEERLKDFSDSIMDSVTMNYQRWEYALGSSHTGDYQVKNDIVKFSDSYEEGLSRLSSWLNERSSFEPCHR